jgi:hypothetical protein
VVWIGNAGWAKISVIFCSINDMYLLTLNMFHTYNIRIDTTKPKCKSDRIAYIAQFWSLGGWRMAEFLVKRVLSSVVTLFVIITVTFFIMHAVPGGPFAVNEKLSQGTIKAMQTKYGLDKPICSNTGLIWATL